MTDSNSGTCNSQVTVGAGCSCMHTDFGEWEAQAAGAARWGWISIDWRRSNPSCWSLRYLPHRSAGTGIGNPGQPFFSTFYLLSDRVNRRIFSVRHVPTAIDRYNTHSAAAHVPISVHPSVLPTTDTCNPNLTFQRYRPIVQYPCRLCLGIAVVNCVTFQTDS